MATEEANGSSNVNGQGRVYSAAEEGILETLQTAVEEQLETIQTAVDYISFEFTKLSPKKISVNIENEVFYGEISQIEMLIYEKRRRKVRRLTRELVDRCVRRLSCQGNIDLVRIPPVREASTEDLESADGSFFTEVEASLTAEATEDEAARREEESAESDEAQREKEGGFLHIKLHLENDLESMDNDDGTMEIKVLLPTELPYPEESDESSSSEEDQYEFKGENGLSDAMKLEIFVYSETRKVLNFLLMAIERCNFLKKKMAASMLQFKVRQRKRRHAALAEEVPKYSGYTSILDRKALTKETVQNTLNNAAYRHCELVYQVVYLDEPLPESPSKILKKKLSRKAEISSQLILEDEENTAKKVRFNRNLMIFDGKTERHSLEKIIVDEEKQLLRPVLKSCKVEMEQQKIDRVAVPIVIPVRKVVYQQMEAKEPSASKQKGRNRSGTPKKRK